jgi:rsbT co-antagonist protein RsbR
MSSLVQPPSREQDEGLQLEQRIAELEAELNNSYINELFFQQSLDMLCIINFDGYFVTFNDALRETLGYSDEEIRSQPFINMVHPDDRDETLKVTEKIMEGSNLFAFANRYRVADGSYKYIQWNVSSDVEQGQMYASARDITALRAIDQEHQILAQVIEEMNSGVSIYQLADHDDPNSLTLINANEAALNLLGGGPLEQYLGKTIQTLYNNGLEEDLILQYYAVATDRVPEGRVTLQTEGEDLAWAFRIDCYKLEKDHISVLTEDITQQLRNEETLRQSLIQEEIIRMQQHTLEELSTPLIPITNSIVIMPLIGSLDSRRAQRVMDTLLHGVAESRSDTVIIDITGVSMVDTQVANVLIRAAEAVKLLGAEAMITGIRPEVAQTLIGLGVNLGTLRTLSSLQNGIALAMEKEHSTRSNRFRR